VLDNSVSLANAGVGYLILKEWSKRRQGEDLRALIVRLTAAFDAVEDARVLVLPPPPIQGIGNSGGFTLVVELRDGSSDFAKLEAVANQMVSQVGSQSAVRSIFTTFRAAAPQFHFLVNRTKAETLGVTVGQVFSALENYVGSTYVTQFNKFGRVFQVYVQADAKFRVTPEDILNLKIKTAKDQMVPLGTLLETRPVHGPALIGLYN